MRNSPLARLISMTALTIIIAGCSGGGDRGPRNPAVSPGSETTIDMSGYWMVVDVSLTSTNTVDTQEFRLGNVILIWQNQLFGRPTIGGSYMRPDVELSLGFPLGWYTNVGNGSTLDFHLGWDRFSQGDGQENYGLRLGAVGPDELIGIESEEWQSEPQLARATWSAAMRFQRMTSFPTQLETMAAGYQAPEIKRFAKPVR